MRSRLASQISLVILSLVVMVGGCASGPRTDRGEAEQIRQVERQRLGALVDAELGVARRLHADDFQLINPYGDELSKQDYLGAIESGQLDYRAWEPGEIAVRLYGDVAVIRYRDVRFEVYVGGRLVHQGEAYHTNLYEKRGGQWQVVWSQASAAVSQ